MITARHQIDYQQDLFGNEQATITFTSGTQYQIVTFDESVYFGLRTASGEWSKLMRFGYCDAWQMEQKDWRPMSESFREMVEQFACDCTEAPW